jgi:hypothetical protein
LSVLGATRCTSTSKRVNSGSPARNGRLLLLSCPDARR